MKKAPFYMVMCLGAALVASTAHAGGPYSPNVANDVYDNGDGNALGTPNESAQDVPGQALHEAIEQILTFTGAPSLGLTNNSQTDFLRIEDDEYWNTIGGGDPSNVAVIAIGAGNTNTLGVFPQGNPAGLVNIAPPQTGFQYLGDGTEFNPFPGGTINLAGNFGFSLTSSASANNTDIWYSDPTLNSDGIDHMMSFSLPSLDGRSLWVDLNGTATEITFGTGTVLLGWEDLPLGPGSFSDEDYNDTIFLISNLADNPTNVVPEPMTMVLFGSGLLGLGRLRRNKVA